MSLESLLEMSEELELELVIEMPEIDQNLSFEENIKNLLDNTKLYRYNKEKNEETL